MDRWISMRRDEGARGTIGALLRSKTDDVVSIFNRTNGPMIGVVGAWARVNLGAGLSLLFC